MREEHGGRKSRKRERMWSRRREGEEKLEEEGAGKGGDRKRKRFLDREV